MVNMKYEINGKQYEAIENDESEEGYKDYDIFCEGKIVGNVTKYDGDRSYRVWDNEGYHEAARATLLGAIKTLIKE